MKKKNVISLSLITFCGLILTGISSFSTNFLNSVKATDDITFIETPVEVSEAHLVPVNVENHRYKIVIYFDSENAKPDFDVGTSTIYDTNGKVLINPINTYDYVSGVKYNNESINVWSGWDNRCEFRQNSLSVMQFAFDFIVSPKQGDVLKLCSGMEIPSYRYCTQQGAEPIKYMLTMDYEFRIGSNLDVDKILGRFIKTSVDNVAFTYDAHPTRVYDGRLKFHLTNNDYPTEEGKTPTEVYGKNANLWSNTNINGCGLSLFDKIKELNIINSDYISYVDSEGEGKTLDGELGQQVMIYSGDCYTGYFDIRILNFALDNGRPNYPRYVRIKEGTEFPVASYLASNETIKTAYRTSEDITINLIEDDYSEEFHVLSEKDYAVELANFKEQAKAELASYKIDTDSFEANRFRYQEAIREGNEMIDSATFKLEAKYYLEISKSLIDEIPTDAQVTQRNIADAITELTTYYNSLKPTHTLYEGLLTERLEEAKKALREVTEYYAVKYALADAKESLDSVPSDDAARQDIINSINLYKDGAKTFTLSSEEYKKIVDEGVAAVMKATSLDELYEIRRETQSKINQLKTDAEIRQSYKDKVDEIFFAFDDSNYSLESINQLMNLIDIATKDIDKAKSIEELDKIISNLISAIEALPVIQTSSSVIDSSIESGSSLHTESSRASDSSNSQDKPTNNGCGGSVVATSLLLTTLSCIGLLIFKNKDGKNNKHKNN